MRSLQSRGQRSTYDTLNECVCVCVCYSCVLVLSQQIKVKPLIVSLTLTGGFTVFKPLFYKEEQSSRLKCLLRDHNIIKHFPPSISTRFFLERDTLLRLAHKISQDTKCVSNHILLLVYFNTVRLMALIYQTSKETSADLGVKTFLRQSPSEIQETRIFGQFQRTNEPPLAGNMAARHFAEMGTDTRTRQKIINWAVWQSE